MSVDLIFRFPQAQLEREALPGQLGTWRAWEEGGQLYVLHNSSGVKDQGAVL